MNQERLIECIIWLRIRDRIWICERRLLNNFRNILSASEMDSTNFLEGLYSDPKADVVPISHQVNLSTASTCKMKSWWCFILWSELIKTKLQETLHNIYSENIFGLTNAMVLQVKWWKSTSEVKYMWAAVENWIASIVHSWFRHWSIHTDDILHTMEICHFTAS